MTHTDERRIAPRLKPALGTLCRFDQGDCHAGPASGLVWNISQSGVSILVATPPAAGAILAGDLTHDNGSLEIPVLMRIVHVRPTPTGDYLLGAAFLRELSAEEVARFADPNG